MKYCIIALLLTLSTGAFAQDLDCKNFKKGTFKLKTSNPETGDYIITRKGKKQIEYNELMALKIKFKVNWIDQCTYTLVYQKTLEDGGKVSATFSKKEVFTVKILEVKPSSYIQETSTNLSDTVLKSELFKIK